jgi:glyoxylase I family protein
VTHVTGIGGFFFRAKDPAALARWYEENLGVPVMPASDEWWPQESGKTVLAAFDADTDYFGRKDQATMINFRVRDLDALLEQLRSAGVEMSDEIVEAPYGRFAWAVDPEGNRFELWEPAGDG